MFHTWFLHGSYMVPTWFLHSSYMVPTWFRHVPTWFLQGSMTEKPLAVFCELKDFIGPGAVSLELLEFKRD